MGCWFSTMFGKAPEQCTACVIRADGSAVDTVVDPDLISGGSVAAKALQRLVGGDCEISGSVSWYGDTSPHKVVCSRYGSRYFYVCSAIGRTDQKTAGDTTAPSVRCAVQTPSPVALSRNVSAIMIIKEITAGVTWISAGSQNGSALYGNVVIFDANRQPFPYELSSEIKTAFARISIQLELARISHGGEARSVVNNETNVHLDAIPQSTDK